MIRLILWWIAQCVLKQRSFNCCRMRVDRGELFRVDAKAEGLNVVLAGWETRPSLSESRWFSVSLTPASAPWAYEKGPPPGEPFRVYCCSRAGG
eukprot:4627306-Heterocapsa_arctica.AAC.1